MRTKILMMSVLTLILTACTKKPVSPDAPYIIEGVVTGLRDGIEIALYQLDGNAGSLITKDTLQGGKFHFEQQLQKPELTRIWLFTFDDNIPSAGGRIIYVNPGTFVKVKGYDNHVMSWEVESKVPEQLAYDKLYGMPEIDPYQDLVDLRNKALSELRQIDSKVDKERYDEARKRYNVINDQEDSVYRVIQGKQIELMKHMKPSHPWIKELSIMAGMSNAYPNYIYTEEAKALYQSLSEDMKQTPEGLEIYSNLYPPKQAMDGDDFPDGDFYDLDGNLHHIAEHKGKYILLDFWSSSCAPCIRAFPEMKEVYEKYGDKLAIISLSSDTNTRWHKASEKHEITWSNWNEMKGEGGLYANYRIGSIPYYVLINPEGKIEKQTSGYSEGKFKTMFGELFD